MPTLIVELKNDTAILFVFADLPDGEEKHKAFFKAGQKVAEGGGSDTVQKIIFTSEAWMRSFPEDVDLEAIGAVRNYPDKDEVIVVTSLDVAGKAKMIMSAMLRKGKYIDFAPIKKMPVTEAPLLKEFWKGYLL